VISTASLSRVSTSVGRLGRMAHLRAEGTFTSVDEIALLTGSLDLRPFDLPVLLDLQSVQRMSRHCYDQLADFVCWRSVWAPVGVVATDRRMVELLTERSIDAVASLGSDVRSVARALSAAAQVTVETPPVWVYDSGRGVRP
jgi:hypothetical protein